MTDPIKAALEAGQRALAESGSCAAIFNAEAWICADRPCLCERVAADTVTAVLRSLHRSADGAHLSFATPENLPENPRVAPEKPPEKPQVAPEIICEIWTGEFERLADAIEAAASET